MKFTPETCQFSMDMLLRQETELTRQLTALLDTEFAAITGRDFTAFEETIRHKAATVEQLDLLGQERTAMLESAGFSTESKGMKSFLGWCDTDDKLKPTWNELLSLAETCRDSNRRNRQLIELCSRNTREALRILRGEEEETDLYQADGATDSGLNNRSLARA